MRVVSLLASGTEILCALGAGDLLVGRSHECDNPEWVRALPACTRPAFDISLASGDIDREVKRRLRRGEALYHVDADLIRTLKPDLLITQVHCAVCAVTPGDVERAGCSVPVSQAISLSAGSVASIYAGIGAVATAIGREAAGASLIAGMQARIDAITNAVQDRPKPTVILVEWTDPIFTSGNWGPELVDAAGGTALLSETGHPSVGLTWKRVLEADPDCLIVAPCGFDLDRTIRDVPILERLPHWFDLRAVEAGRVALADGNRYFNRSGITIVDTVEILGEILHATGLEPRWHGTAWLRYAAPASDPVPNAW